MAGLNQSTMLMFDKEDDKINDICLVVKDRKFWCSKQHLSLHSDYFCTMLNGGFPEANMKKIVLNAPQTSMDFHLFLLIINGLRPFEEFDDEVITRVLALSNQWFAKVASGICMEHLLKSEKSTLKDKFSLAVDYRLDEYKAKLIANIKTTEELASIVPRVPTTLDQDTKDKLFLKSLELNGIQRLASELAPNPLISNPPGVLNPRERHRQERRPYAETMRERESRYRQYFGRPDRQYQARYRYRLEARRNDQRGGDARMEEGQRQEGPAPQNRGNEERLRPEAQERMGRWEIERQRREEQRREEQRRLDDQEVRRIADELHLQRREDGAAQQRRPFGVMLPEQRIPPEDDI